MRNEVYIRNFKNIEEMKEKLKGLVFMFWEMRIDNMFSKKFNDIVLVERVVVVV